MYRNYKDRYYYKKNRMPIWKQLLLGIGGAAFIFAFGVLLPKLFGKNVEANVNDPVPSFTVGDLVEDPEPVVTPAVVIPQYETYLSIEAREGLNQYLREDANHSCSDLEAKGVTTTDHLRLRKGPGTEYEIITELSDDTYIRVLGVCDNDWYLVSLDNGTVGFVSGEFLRVLTPEYINSQTIEPSTCVLRGIRSNTSLNVRDSASVEGNIIGALSEGQVIVSERHLENGWWQIQYGDRTGYVSGDYVTEVYATSLEDMPLVYIRDDTSMSERPYENGTESVPAGQFMRMYGENDDYYLISNNGHYGYVSKDDCERMSDYYAIIDLSENTLRVYHLGEEVLCTRVSNGKASTPTPTGFFSIYCKLDDTLMSGEDYTNVYVENVLYYKDGCAIHKGDPNVESHGCTHVDGDAIQLVYSYLNVGDRVFVED